MRMVGFPWVHMDPTEKRPEISLNPCKSMLVPAFGIRDGKAKQLRS